MESRSKITMVTPRIIGLFLVAAALAGCGQQTSRDHDKQLNPLAQANQIILLSLADPDPRARTFAIEIVASTRQLRFMPKIRYLVRDPEVPVRFAALVAIGDVRYSVVEADLLQVFEEDQEDRNVRMAAAYALVRLDFPEYGKYCYQGLSDPDPTVQANAALLLGKSGDPRAVEALGRALSETRDEKVVAQIVESLALLGDTRVYEKLWTRLISAYADDRIAGIQAMGALGTEQARQSILTLLEDGVPEVRLSAAAQLGRLNDASGRAKVIEVIKMSTSPGDSLDASAEQARLMMHAALAIGEIGTPDLTAYLGGLLSDDSKYVRLAAAKATFASAVRGIDRTRGSSGYVPGPMGP